MSQYIQSNYIVTYAAPLLASLTNLISATDSGKTIIFLAQTAIQTYTLPPASVGLRYRFMAGAAIGFNVTIASNPVGIIYGTLVNMTPGGAGVCVVASVQKAGANNVVLTGAAAHLGDYVDMNCDGQYWYVNGVATVAGGLA